MIKLQFDRLLRNKNDVNFLQGTIGIIEISRFASYGYDQRCEVFGPKGMLIVNNNSPNGTISHNNLGISR